jgi:hypothetical protein
MGKPIGNGHPMGAVACRPEIAAAFANGMEYFNTFGGNPVSAAAGLAVLDIIRDERLMHNAAMRGDQLRDGFKALAERHPLIGNTRGLGLFIGVELVRDRDTLEPAAEELDAIVEAMKEEGILLSTEGPHHNVLKIKPPLVISKEECDFFLAKLDEVMTRLGFYSASVFTLVSTVSMPTWLRSWLAITAPSSSSMPVTCRSTVSSSAPVATLNSFDGTMPRLAKTSRTRGRLPGSATVRTVRQKVGTGFRPALWRGWLSRAFIFEDSETQGDWEKPVVPGRCSVRPAGNSPNPEFRLWISHAMSLCGATGLVKSAPRAVSGRESCCTCAGNLLKKTPVHAGGTSRARDDAENRSWRAGRAG